MQTIPHWISGRRAEREGRPGDVWNPATGQAAAKVAYASAAVVDEVVASAKAAFASWRDASLARRSRVMFAFRELLERRKQDLARAITLEHGKVLSDAVGEVNRGLEVVEFACGIPHLLKGAFS